MFGLFKEKRSSLKSVSETGFAEFFGLSGNASFSMEDALGVPAVWAAINFMSGTMAGLPCSVYEKDRKGVKRKVKATAANPIVGILGSVVNDDLSSFQWRFDMFNAVLSEGRDVTYIERDGSGRVINLFPMNNVQVSRLENGRKLYTSGTGAFSRSYDQSEVIDLTFMLKKDRLSHRSPLNQCAVAIGKAIAANRYGTRLFENGGLPAFALHGPFGSEKSAVRAGENIAEATKEAARKGANVLAIPTGHTLVPLGSDPEKMQLVGTQEFGVLEVARVYCLPPTFLQDLSRATFSNSEQQDLHLVKHTLKRWVEQLEAEINIKIFGRNSNRWAEFNMDGLLRGDYKTRMEGNSLAIQTGQMTPNEARKLDNREPLDGGDKLYIQGATVPLDHQQNGQPTTTPQTQTSGTEDGL